MTVSTFGLPSSIVDGDLAVLARIAAAYAPHETDPASLAIAIDAGHVMVGTMLIENDEQLVSGFSAPTSNTRIDRVVLNPQTGVASRIAGTESATPVPPAIPAGFLPLAQVKLRPSQVKILNEDITDERDFTARGASGASGGLINVQYFSASGVYTPTPGTTSVIVEAVGGGGSGGGCAATGSNQSSAGGGGAAGSYGRARITSGFAGVTVTVGLGASATSPGAAGADGQASSFGNLLIAPGGWGGTAGVATSSPAATWGTNGGLSPTGANLGGGGGGAGGIGLALSPSSSVGGRGGDSVVAGASAGSINGGAGGGNPSSNAAGGGGGASNIANMAARAGGPANGGVVVVWEYA